MDNGLNYNGNGGNLPPSQVPELKGFAKVIAYGFLLCLLVLFAAFVAWLIKGMLFHV